MAENKENNFLIKIDDVLNYKPKEDEMCGLTNPGKCIIVDDSDSE